MSERNISMLITVLQIDFRVNCMNKKKEETRKFNRPGIIAETQSLVYTKNFHEPIYTFGVLVANTDHFQLLHEILGHPNDHVLDQRLVQPKHRLLLTTVPPVSFGTSGSEKELVHFLKKKWKQTVLFAVWEKNILYIPKKMSLSGQKKQKLWWGNLMIVVNRSAKRQKTLLIGWEIKQNDNLLSAFGVFHLRGGGEQRSRGFNACWVNRIFFVSLRGEEKQMRWGTGEI